MTSRAPAAGARDGLLLGTAYWTSFGALAASAPFLALVLGDVGFAAPDVAQLLAVFLLVRVLAIPTWTWMADRTHAVAGTLRLASAGGLASFAVLLLGPPRAAVAVALLAFAFFRAPFGALLDTLMLRAARASGAVFGAVRAWGTAGYAICALVTGKLLALHGTRAMIWGATALLAAALATSFAVHDGGEAKPERHEANARDLFAVFRRPRILLLLLIALLEELGLAPYDNLFPSYLARVAGADAAGTAVALGAAAEFVFMLAAPRLARRLGPERLLALACAGSALRWAGIAVSTSPLVLVGLQAFHALSFGAFYMSSVIMVDRETPPALRASGQGLFGSLTFGVAASIGVSMAGLLERRAGGMTAIFGVAAVASVAATLLALFFPAPSSTAERSTPLVEPGG
ncbi:MAG TPA: MFS transporter [Polyangiaceae bacterium]